MANSRYEYVRHFETYNTAMLNTYMVVRVDGKGFTKYTEAHKYEKPNDLRGLQLMNQCAMKVMETYVDIWIAFGESDEYSFVFTKDSKLYNRRTDKITSLIASCFSSAFVFYFPKFFPNQELLDIPLFDSRLVCYPSEQNLRDYLSWRQADTHINNLYNTSFWCLVQKDGLTQEGAHSRLKGTYSDEKNQLLYEHDINYSKIEPIYRKGSIVVRLSADFLEQKKTKDSVINTETAQEETKKSEEQPDFQNGELNTGENQDTKPENNEETMKKGKKPKKVRAKDLKLVILHEDLIQKDFWEKYKDFLML